MSGKIFLRRCFGVPPYDRYAFTITPADNPDGYVVSDVDASVADPGFLAAFRDHMQRPVTARGSYEIGGTIAETAVPVGPRDDGHFAVAVRTFTGSQVWGTR